MKDLIEFIVKALVDSPDTVAVQEVEGDKVTVYELTVSPDDIGKVIGKEGRTIKSIRTVMSCAAAKLNKRVMLELIE